MSRLCDLTGRKFGRLTVVSRVYGRRTTWRCRCRCGSKCLILSTNLIHGRTKSCGCLRQERAKRFMHNYMPRRKPTRRGFANALAATYRASAKRRLRVIPFQLSTDDCIRLFFACCHYCGRKPMNRFSTTSGAYLNWRYNGIDRLNVSKGYIVGNVVTACADCNYAKQSMTYRQFKRWLRRVHDHLFA